MDFRFVVSASVERTEGKFASRDELEQQLQEAIEGADPGSVSGDNGGEYEVTDWVVDAEALKVVGPGARAAREKPKRQYARDEVLHAMGVIEHLPQLDDVDDRLELARALQRLRSAAEALR